MEVKHKNGSKKVVGGFYSFAFLSRQCIKHAWYLGKEREWEEVKKEKREKKKKRKCRERGKMKE